MNSRPGRVNRRHLRDDYGSGMSGFFTARSGALLACALLALVSSRGFAATLNVGIEINNEPLSFIDHDGRPSGFAVELIEAVAAETGLTITPVAGPWDDIFKRFKAGEIDALASLVYSKERDQFIDFSVTHLKLHGNVFVRKDGANPRTLEELGTLRIAVPPKGFTEEYLVAHRLDKNLVFVSSLTAALEALDQGKCDAFAATGLIASHFIRERGFKNIEKSPLELPGFFYELHMGVRAGDSDRLALLNEGLARIHANGTYDRLHEKWIGPIEHKHLTASDVIPYLLPAAAFLALITGALIWQRSMLKKLARQAEAIRRSEHRLTLVLEGSEDGFWDWDLRTDRVERSERWAAMLGYTLAEIDPTLEGGLALLHPEDRSAYDIYRTELTSGGGNRHDIEYRMKTKSGDWRWMLERGKVVARAPDGTPLRVAGTRADITDLKHAREELIRQEARFRFIYQHVPVGISWLRREQAETRLVNPAHERITGVRATNARVTANYVQATHPDDRERQHVLQTRLDRGEIDNFSMEKRYVHPDGSVVWALITVHRYHDPVTHEAQTVTTLVDTSVLKRAEEDRRNLHLKILETQKLESLGVLAGGIAHDFNNLLTVILANASFARLETASIPASREPLDHIESAARRAADLCRQMLAYAGKGNFVVERLDLNQLLQSTAQLLQISISKKARLVIHLAGDLPLVEGDASQLQQVLMNLVINASDALGENSGEIRLRTWRGHPESGPGMVTHAFETPPGECACLEVSDTGKGMDAATLARIFDPFFTTKFTGRGLGLAAVLGIMRSCHGTLTVESQPGHGTTFRLYIPASLADARPVRPARTAAPFIASSDASRGTILIADDEPAVLNTFDQQLRRNGYQTILAADGHEAVKHFRTAPDGFAALLLDLTMPGLDGAEVLREVRALKPGACVLIMSGFSEKDVLDRLAGLGPVSILQKPFTLDTLLQRLREVTAAAGSQ
ncbi:MAG: transporter substrate-binding domain-containing protein [Nibricoccus sp.]